MAKTAAQSFVSQFEPLLPSAINVIKESVEGRAVNPERLKTAKFVASSVKAGHIIEKEKRLVGLNEKKFNLGVVDKFGSEEQKNMIKDVVRKSLSLKFLED